jgi:hypothetical protein
LECGEFVLQFADGALEFQAFAIGLFLEFAQFFGDVGLADRKGNEPDRKNEQEQAVENRDEVKEGQGFAS